MTDHNSSHPVRTSEPVIHRGPWVIAGPAAAVPEANQDIIKDGALLVADGLIQAVGKFRDIAREYGHFTTVDHEGCVLAPALINGHCHLELSHLNLAGRTSRQRNYNGDITAWIRDLLAEREKFLHIAVGAEEIILNSARRNLQLMSAAGTAFIGDVGNNLASRSIGHKQNTKVVFLLELLGLTKQSETKNIARLEKITAEKSLDIGCTAHAPYSTSPGTIQAIKKEADRKGRIFSLHVAESVPEIEFLQAGTGPLPDFLSERGGWDNSFAIPGKGSVHYLDSLGVLNDKTLCVHGVHVDKEEIQILAEKKVKVCLCPGSNRFLDVGKAPVTDYLAHGILPALGTDSRASNEVLDLWREMRLLREDHPALPPKSVFAMATLGGAEAWGIASGFGSISPGKRALALAVNCRENINRDEEVFDYLTSASEPAECKWLGIDCDAY